MTKTTHLERKAHLSNCARGPLKVRGVPQTMQKENHLTTDPTGHPAREPNSRPSGPSEAPDFQQVRKYLRSIQQREALGNFVKAGWTSAELGEFARAVFLAPGKSYPTAASYQYAMDKGADHPYVLETLASLRAPGFTVPPFNRPAPHEFAWDDPDILPPVATRDRITSAVTRQCVIHVFVHARSA